MLRARSSSAITSCFSSVATLAKSTKTFYHRPSPCSSTAAPTLDEAAAPPIEALVLVPEAFFYSRTGVAPTEAEQIAIAALGGRYVDAALSEPAVAAVMAFVGPHQVYGADIFYGAFEMPPVLDLYRRVGETMPRP